MSTTGLGWAIAAGLIGWFVMDDIYRVEAREMQWKVCCKCEQEDPTSADSQPECIPKIVGIGEHVVEEDWNGDISTSHYHTPPIPHGH